MSDKMTCPGCNAHTSGVFSAYTGDRDECPYCGLSGEAIREVHAARRRGADAELTAKYEAATVRAAKLEAEVEDLRLRIERARTALDNRQRGVYGE